MKLWKTLVADYLNHALVESRVQPTFKTDFKTVRVLYFREKILKKENASAKLFKVRRLVHELVVNDCLTGKETVEMNKQNLTYFSPLRNFRTFIQRDVLKVVKRKR